MTAISASRNRRKTDGSAERNSHKMKSIRFSISLLLCCLLFISAIPFSASAAGTVSMADVKAHRGETVTLTISISDCEQFKSGSIEIDYGNVLSYVSAGWTLSNTKMSSFNQNENKGVFTYDVNTTVSGDIFRISLSVPDDAAFNVYEVSYTLLFRNNEGNEFSYNGSADVEVSDYDAYSPLTDFTYTTSGSELTITGYTGSATSVSIGEKYDIGGTEYTVTKIDGGASGAFEGNTTLTRLYIPASVTSIAAYSFYDCTALKDVTIAGCPTIGERAVGYYYVSRSQDAVVDGFTLRGWTGDMAHYSSAQIYAAENSITYAALDKVTLRGYQKSDMSGAEFNIRFAATIDRMEYESVGFEVSATTHTGKSWRSEDTTVYASLLGQSSDGKTMEAVTAAQFGDSCIFALGLRGVPTGESISFLVKPYVVNPIGATVYGAAHNVNVSVAGVITTAPVV